MKKLSNTEAELKKMLLTKKGCIPMLNRINNKLSRLINLNNQCLTVPSSARHKSCLSHVNVFFSHYGRQLKTVVEQEVGEKIDRY